jgi:hypothetical protein
MKSKGNKMGGKMRSKGGAMMKTKGMRRGGKASKGSVSDKEFDIFKKAKAKKAKPKKRGMGGPMNTKGYAKGGAMKSKGGAKGGIKKPSSKNSGLFGR